MRGFSMSGRAGWLLGCSLAALSSGAAHAGTSPSEGGKTAAPLAVEEVVVTAQRRPEDVQKSSVPISVLTAQALSRAGVTQPQDLNTVTPGLQLGMAGPTAQPYIRGVGNADNTGFSVSGVAFNVDGVYIAPPIAYGTALFDIDRVEVLKGPQGTLYGRNATGGAINILTGVPSASFGGYVGADVNNYGLANVNGAVNMPVNARVEVRAAFQVGDRDGYFRDGTSDDRSQEGRVRVKLMPANDLTVLLNFDASHVGGKGPGSAFDLGSTYNIPNPWSGTQGPNSKQYIFAANPNAEPAIDQNGYGVSSEIVWKPNDFSFTLIPSYRDVTLSSLSYAQGLQFHTLSNTYHETTVEARVGYDSNRVKWVGGIYYFNQDQTVNFDVDFDVIQLGVRVPKLNTESYAAFTQGTYSFTDALRVVGGVRYSHEDQSGHGVDTYASPPLGVLPFSADIESHSVDYRAGLEYDVAKRNMIYATVATGYKAGGFFPSPAGPFGSNTFKPERLTAYEVGSRNQFFNRTLQVNIEGFYWLYKDKQETFGGLDGIGILDNITRNAGDATSRGVDLDLVWKPTANDHLTASGEYLDAVYNKFVYDSPIPSQGCANPAPGVIDCSDRQMSRAPRWSANFGYDHTFDLGDRVGTLNLAGNVNFVASRWLAATFSSNMHAPANTTESLFATYVTPSQKWSLTVYVRNLSNEVVATNAYPSILPNISALSLNPPRTYGVQMKVKF